jgi:hypothetical protein
VSLHTLPKILESYFSYVLRTSCITPVSWRTQRVLVRSVISDLSAFNVATGLTSFPMRPMPSPFIPRSSSLVFHPLEMVYALGQPDSTGKYLLRRLAILMLTHLQ